MSCLCAPTTHAGSFRCRLHRPQQSWGGRPMPAKSAGDEEFEFPTASDSSAFPMREQCLNPVASLPSPPSHTSSRSPPRGASRLNHVVMSSPVEEADVLKTDTNGEKFHTVKMVTGSGGSYACTPGAKPSVFRMLKAGHGTTKSFS